MECYWEVGLSGLLDGVSCGNNIAAHRTKKNKTEWKKNPKVVGQPPLSAIVIKNPNTFCVILNVSGFAIKKNISVE